MGGGLEGGGAYVCPGEEPIRGGEFSQDPVQAKPDAPTQRDRPA